MPSEAKVLSYDEAIDVFSTYLIEEGKSASTIQNYPRDVKGLGVWLEDYDPGITGGGVSKIGKIALKDYAQFLKTSREVAANTCNRRIYAIKAFFKYLYEKNFIDTNPAQSLKPKKIQKNNEVKWLERAEVSKVFHTIDNMKRAGIKIKVRNKAITSIFVNCGLRVEELCDLWTDDLDFEKRVLTVQHGKNCKFRKLPLGKATIKAVKLWLDYRDGEGELLFSTKRSPQMTTRAVQHVYERIRKESGVEVTPHTLRHTFGKQIVDETNNLRYAADLLGHTDINTTRIYTTPSIKELGGAVEKVEFDG